MATTSATSSLVIANGGVNRSEFFPPWITPMPWSRSHSSVLSLP
jgi:hypothetical protein